ncbi:hypothetical protein BYT27DRAFT_7194998 [Phlegmacium glaucopus]|nr:hypothetical protein BYT27DRAFT_7194998 [Phlegmacium glaucopus]
MSTLYTSLQVSPKKKRCPPELDDANILTPKKLRTAPPTPPASTSRAGPSSKQPLPPDLTRLYNIQTALHHALSHALATCAISPTSDSGLIRNVLDHMSLTTYAGFGTSFDIDDLKRLCWIWEWDGKSIAGTETMVKSEEEDNPFLESSVPNPPPAEWTRGSMGLVLSSATHYSRVDRKRVPAYGIGIEVEMDIDKDMGGGMAAVARWTATAEKRRLEFRNKLERWITLHRDVPSVPNIPLADLPELSGPKVSALTRTLASCSPSAVTSIKFPAPPSSPSRSPTKKSDREFAIPLTTRLSTSKSPLKKSSILFPQTPSRRDQLGKSVTTDRPQTPSSSNTSPFKDSSVPSTPKHQTGSSTGTPGTTPSTSRRQALYERVRQRSLSMSPTKAPRPDGTTPSMTRDQMLKMSQDEMRQRCLLGRLGGVAESIWMLFSNPTTGTSSTPGRKRRALPIADIIAAIVKSSPVPISAAEANESMSMLIKLCPFFVKKLHISGKEWIEMPASNAPSTAIATEGTPTKNKPNVLFSPGRLKGKDESAQELVTRSPRRVKREGGGLREVREIIRRELDLQD